MAFRVEVTWLISYNMLPKSLKLARVKFCRLPVPGIHVRGKRGYAIVVFSDIYCIKLNRAEKSSNSELLIILHFLTDNC